MTARTRLRCIRAPALAGLLILAACTDSIGVAGDSCAGRTRVSADQVVTCLRQTGSIGSREAAVADSVFAAADSLVAALAATSDYSRFRNSGIVLAAKQHFTDFYDRGLLTDSVRFNRMVDHVAVTLEFVRGELAATPSGLYFPRRTPDLGWSFQDQVGIYFEPSLTMERRMGAVPPILHAAASEFLRLGEAMWSYGEIRRSGGRPEMVWELEYSARTCIADEVAPRISAGVQGPALNLFTELFRVTADPLWRDRARAVLTSLDRGWSDRGVRLDDTTHGYWWESASPPAMTWRGDAETVVAVLRYAALTGDTSATRLGRGGLAALAYWTPMFDTGSRLRYCLAGGFASSDTQQIFVALARALFAETGDSVWDVRSIRWAGYAAGGA